MEILIVHPKTLKLIQLEEWKRSENPTSAKLIVIKTKGKKLCVSKNGLLDEYRFDDAQKAAAAFALENFPKLKFRNPTRKECIDIYDARFAGLDEAIELLGGDAISKYWFWTSESDTNPKYNSEFAFWFNCNGGTMNYYSKYATLTVRPVTTFNKKED